MVCRQRTKAPPGHVLLAAVIEEFEPYCSRDLAMILRIMDHPRITKHHIAFWQREGIEDQIRLYEEKLREKNREIKNRFSSEKPFNKLPDMEMFRKVAKEYRLKQQKMWG